MDTSNWSSCTRPAHTGPAHIRRLRASCVAGCLLFVAATTAACSDDVECPTGLTIDGTGERIAWLQPELGERGLSADLVVQGVDGRGWSVAWPSSTGPTPQPARRCRPPHCSSTSLAAR